MLHNHNIYWPQKYHSWRWSVTPHPTFPHFWDFSNVINLLGENVAFNFWRFFMLIGLYREWPYLNQCLYIRRHVNSHFLVRRGMVLVFFDDSGRSVIFFKKWDMLNVIPDPEWTCLVGKIILRFRKVLCISNKTISNWIHSLH